MIDDKILEYGEPTPRQRELIEAYRKHGTFGKAGKALGVAHSCVSNALRRVEEKAARRGYAPAEGLNNPAPAGFQVGQAWIRRNADGDVLRITEHIKPEQQAIRQAFLDAVRDLAEPYKGTSPVIEPPEDVFDDLFCVYGFGDMHIGMLAWGAECGGDDFNLDIADRMYRSAIRRAVDKAPAAKRALLCFVGDNLHANGSDWLTPKSKHALDSDSRFQKVTRLAAWMIVYMIEMALNKHELVEVVIALGNHDFDASAGLALAVEMYFANNERVRVDTTPGRFHFFEHGKCFFGVTHGDTVKPPKLPLLMATRKPEEWGRSKTRKWYTGHLHTEISRDYGACKVETLATLSPKDAYAHEGGWDHIRQTICDVWHKDGRRVSRLETHASEIYT